MNREDLINYKYEGIKTRERMSLEKRASQFSPFAALSGYYEKIEEQKQILEDKILLSSYEKEIINNNLRYLEEHKKDSIYVNINYFYKDKNKEKGKYISIKGIFKRIDKINKLIEVEDNIININDIRNIKIIKNPTNN